MSANDKDLATAPVTEACEEESQKEQQLGHVATAERVPLFSWGSQSAPSLPSVDDQQSVFVSGSLLNPLIACIVAAASPFRFDLSHCKAATPFPALFCFWSCA